jgi:hypothetical protein
MKNIIMKNIIMKNINYIFIIFIFIFIILFLYLIYTNKTLYKNEKFENEINNNNIEIIIARYNEDLEWLNDEKFNKYPVIIYNKGVNDSFYKPPLLKEIVNLPNIGVCDHTYLYHIIKNYNNLPNVTIFLPGSCMDGIKKNRTINILEKTIETNNSVIYGRNEDTGILNNLYDFNMETHESSNHSNKLLNGDSELRKCDVNPFGNWFKTVFGDININYSTYFGIFSASKQHILNRKKDFYEKLIEYVNKDKNEECAHYIERSYIAIFHPLPNECIIVDNSIF